MVEIKRYIEIEDEHLIIDFTVNGVDNVRDWPDRLIDKYVEFIDAMKYDGIIVEADYPYFSFIIQKCRTDVKEITKKFEEFILECFSNPTIEKVGSEIIKYDSLDQMILINYIRNVEIEDEKAIVRFAINNCIDIPNMYYMLGFRSIDKEDLEKEIIEMIEKEIEQKEYFIKFQYPYFQFEIDEEFVEDLTQTFIKEITKIIEEFAHINMNQDLERWLYYETTTIIKR